MTSDSPKVDPSATFVPQAHFCFQGHQPVDSSGMAVNSLRCRRYYSACLFGPVLFPSLFVNFFAVTAKALVGHGRPPAMVTQASGFEFFAACFGIIGVRHGISTVRVKRRAKRNKEKEEPNFKRSPPNKKRDRSQSRRREKGKPLPSSGRAVVCL